MTLTVTHTTSTPALTPPAVVQRFVRESDAWVSFWTFVAAMNDDGRPTRLGPGEIARRVSSDRTGLAWSVTMRADNTEHAGETMQACTPGDTDLESVL